LGTTDQKSKIKKNFIATFLKWLSLSILSIIIGFILFLNIPQVQNTLFKRVLNKLNVQTQFHIQHQHFSLKWFHKVLLTDLSVKDSNNQLLCAIKCLKLRINPFRFFRGEGIVIDYLEVGNGDLRLIKAKADSVFNIQILLSRLEIPNSSISVGVPIDAKGFSVNKAVLKGFSILIDDQTIPSILTGFDPHHFKAERINAEVRQLGYHENTLVGELQHFSGYDPIKNLKLHQLHTQFKITPYGTLFNKLLINTDNSCLKGNLSFSYEGITDMSTILTHAYIDVELEELKLASKELAHFIPYFKDHNTDYTLKGSMVGKAADFHLKDFYLEFGKNKSYLCGDISLKGLPDFEKLCFDLNLRKGRLYTFDLLPHVTQEHHHILQRIQLCNVQSNISGTLHQFKAKGNFITNIGRVTTDMEVAVDKASREVTCKGDVNTQSLNIGKLLGIDELHELTMRAYVNGQSINSNAPNLYLRTHIEQLGFQGYRYEHIRADGRLGNLFFKGSVSVDDPNLVAYFDTKIDWKKPCKELSIKGLLSNAALDKLKITNKQAHFSSDINVVIQGDSWDDFTTDATFNRIQLEIEDKPLYMEQLHFLNGKKDGHSTLSLYSDLLDVQAEGAVKYTSLVHDFKEFVHAYQQRLLTSKVYVPSYTEKPYNFKYHLYLKDINPILQVIGPHMYVAPHTSFQGFFSQQEEVKFEFHMHEVDSLAFGGNQLQRSEWHITALQNKDGALIAATNKLKADKQQWKDYTSTENFALDINWVNDQISFKNSIGHENSNLQLNLAGTAGLHHTGVHISLDNTAIRVAGKQWELHSAGTVSIHPSHIKFHNILLSNEAQQISIEGKYSSTNSEKLIINLTNLDLNNFTPFIDRKMGGNIHGTLILTGTTEKPRVSSNINIHAITIGDLMVGDLCAKATWDNGNKGINVACQLNQLEKPIIHITGAYNHNDKAQGLDLVAEFSHAQLALIEPFFTNVFGELKGEVEGKFYIKGPLKAPSLDGKATVRAISLKFNYLNASYKGYGEVHCSGNNIKVEKLVLMDDEDGQANVQGDICHTYFKDFSLNLTGDISKLKVLNAKYEDNEYFYGKGIVSGNVAFTGMIDNIMITADAVTQKGSSLVIPIQKYNKKVGQESYIRFVDLKTCKKNTVEAPPSIKVKGLSLNMNLEITPDAWAEIILNRKDGDVIQSKGKGLLTIKSDLEGNLNITGNYELVEGTYNFSVYEVVKRKFKILEGSTITWIDKPYDGILHVRAAYNQRATLTPLLEQNEQAIKDKKKYPISVILTLEGILSDPDIHFNIEFPKPPDNPDLQEAIHTFKEKAASDRNYLEKQVFSLVMLRTLFSDNIGNFGDDTIKRSVGEIFSQQLSSIAAQLDENLEIDTDIDLEELTQEKTTSLPVKLSYNLLAGRLIISRESRINFDTGKEIDFANMVGDWSVEYGLTSDNRFRIKLHISPSGSETGTGMSNISKSVFGGLSFVYIKSFNKWRELFRHSQYHKAIVHN
jgi:hypothetical protein